MMYTVLVYKVFSGVVVISYMKRVSNWKGRMSSFNSVIKSSIVRLIYSKESS